MNLRLAKELCDIAKELVGSNKTAKVDPKRVKLVREEFSKPKINKRLIERIVRQRGFDELHEAMTLAMRGIGMEGAGNIQRAQTYLEDNYRA